VGAGAMPKSRGSRANTIWNSDCIAVVDAQLPGWPRKVGGVRVDTTGR
jgi:hypothetical protein